MKNGSTPLIYAAELGFTEIVSILLDRGAKINAKDKVQYGGLVYM
jgi:ankyrin repeat protein